MPMPGPLRPSAASDGQLTYNKFVFFVWVFFLENRNDHGIYSWRFWQGINELTYIHHSGWFAVSNREVFGCYGASRSPKGHVQMISAVPLSCGRLRHTLSLQNSPGFKDTVSKKNFF